MLINKTKFNRVFDKTSISQKKCNIWFNLTKPSFVSQWDSTKPIKGFDRVSWVFFEDQRDGWDTLGKLLLWQKWH